MITSLKNFLRISILSLIMLCSSCTVLNNILMEPTALETITALREVLNSSTFRAIKTLKDVSSNGVEGVLPDQLHPVLNTLKNVGLGGEIDKVTDQIGVASGVVLDESSIIITDAIKQVDFGDAVSVVLGGEDAATAVLRQAMYASVKNRYSERLDTELGKTDALKYWPMATGAYNLFAKEKINGTLSDFISEKAVDALFLTMGKKEAEIRKDPASLGKAVVTKVFDYYQNRKSNNI